MIKFIKKTMSFFNCAVTYKNYENNRVVQERMEKEFLPLYNPHGQGSAIVLIVTIVILMIGTIFNQENWIMTAMFAFWIVCLPANSSEDKIKKKYRELSMKNHPDRTGVDVEMKKINNANDFLLG